ncbi:MAG: hypothetical protein ACYCXZ_03885 [Coriobacteriia bacterium]
MEEIRSTRNRHARWQPRPDTFTIWLLVHGATKEVQRFRELARGSSRQYHDFEFSFESIVATPKPLLPFHFPESPISAEHRTRLLTEFGFEEQGGYRLARWGSRQGPFDVRVEHEDDSVHYWFWTIDGPPAPVVAQASGLFPTLTFSMHFRSEDAGIEGDYCIAEGVVTLDEQGPLRIAANERA